MAESHKVFFAGAMAGIIEGVTVQPLEMIKTRFQINTGQRMRVLQTIREVIKEGGVMRLYRGALPEIVGIVPRSTALWSAFGLHPPFLCREHAHSHQLR